MTRLLSSALLSAALLLLLPLAPVAADSASANCRQGSPNCTSPTIRTPKFCNPCQIDSGLGSKCKNFTTCGIKHGGGGGN